jgi:hypothetical protein
MRRAADVATGCGDGDGDEPDTRTEPNAIQNQRKHVARLRRSGLPDRASDAPIDQSSVDECGKVTG